METDNYLDYGVVANPEIDDDSTFLGGHLISAELPPLIFEVNFPKNERLPHFLGDEVPLVSGTLAQALQAAGVDNFQVFPAKLVNTETGQTWDNFFAFNVIGLIKAAHLDHSDFDELMEAGDDDEVPALLAFREVTLDKDKVPANCLMFRMVENPGNLIVREHVVDVLSENKPKGGWGIDVIEVDLV